MSATVIASCCHYHQTDDIIWVDDFTDCLACLIDLKRRNTTVTEIFRLLMAKKIHSTMAWGDPIPIMARIVNLGSRAISLLVNSLSGRLRKSGN